MYKLIVEVGYLYRPAIPRLNLYLFESCQVLVFLSMYKYSIDMCNLLYDQIKDKFLI
jgi:hypothetical protein